MIDQNYRGKLNFITCPLTGELIRFSRVDTKSATFVFYYIVENSDITYVAVGYKEDENTVYKSSSGQCYFLRGNELIRSISTFSGFIEKPNILKRIKYHWIPKILSIFIREEKAKNIFLSSVNTEEFGDFYKRKIDVFDYPVISSINRGDILILTKLDKEVEIIVKKISESLVVSTSGNVYDLYEWKWARKLNN